MCRKEDNHIWRELYGEKVKDMQKWKLVTVGSVHWLAVGDSEGGMFALSSGTDVPWYIHNPVIQETSSYPPTASSAPGLLYVTVIVEIKKATCHAKFQIKTGLLYSSRALCLQVQVIGIILRWKSSICSKTQLLEPRKALFPESKVSPLLSR